MSKGDKNDKSLARKIKSHVESCHKHTFAVSIIDGQVFLMGEQGVNKSKSSQNLLSVMAQ